MTNTERAYLPAAGRDSLLPLYDPVVKLIGGDRVRRVLIDQATLRPSDRVLDIGCGTGTLAALIKRIYPSVEVTGLDPDPKALARARRKAEHTGLMATFDQGFSGNLPYPDAYFDRAFSSFMFHHLPEYEREKMLSEARRVLKPGGSLHLLDFAGPDAHGHGSILTMLHSSEHLKDNTENRILTLFKEAGFSYATRVLSGSMLFGLLKINYFQGSVS
jgi:ubiquinone/menaquinone biosynthesis C-methylase UbiE